MALKFDGTKLVDGGKTFANVKGDKIYEGMSQSKTLANIKGDKIYDGMSQSKTLANVKGDKIYEGMSQSRVLFKTSDAAKKIGSTSQGPLTAALWYLFCR